MKIRLRRDLPIDEKHGAKKGRTFAVTQFKDGKYFALGKAGTHFVVLPAECRELPAKTPPPAAPQA